MPRLDQKGSAREAIMDKISRADAPYRPARLISELKGAGLNEQVIRSAMWQLIDRRQLSISPDRKLVRDEPASETGGDIVVSGR
jgi:hypothetical protein